MLGFLCSGTVACFVLTYVCKVMSAYKGANMCGNWRNSKKLLLKSNVCMYVYLYIYVSLCVCVCIKFSFSPPVPH